MKYLLALLFLLTGATSYFLSQWQLNKLAAHLLQNDQILNYGVNLQANRVTSLEDLALGDKESLKKIKTFREELTRQAAKAADKK